MATKVALVTGASSGIGASAARKLHDLGYVVYGAARRVEKMKDLADAGYRGARHGRHRPRFDGRGRAPRSWTRTAGSTCWSTTRATAPTAPSRTCRWTRRGAQFEVNVFGAAALIQLVTPHMRAQGSGRIINITSMGGKITTPFGGWYHGTKFALEALSDSLRSELRPSGSTSW